jgi:hypothetical protein
MGFEAGRFSDRMRPEGFFVEIGTRLSATLRSTALCFRNLRVLKTRQLDVAVQDVPDEFGYTIHEFLLTIRGDSFT